MNIQLAADAGSAVGSSLGHSRGATITISCPRHTGGAADDMCALRRRRRSREVEGRTPLLGTCFPPESERQLRL